jgi:hypothetical protein
LLMLRQGTAPLVRPANFGLRLLDRDLKIRRRNR